jgi:predicted small lipoprotein YifL
MKNANTRNIFAKTVTIVLIGAFALGACGIKGDLQTPPPLWGDKDKQAESADEKKPVSDKQESNN